MAYGQTGSGKTFTMGTSGDDDDNADDDADDADDADDVNNGNATAASANDTNTSGPVTDAGRFGERGMTPRCIADLYQRLDATGLSYEVTCSVLELYKDELRDLQRGGEYLDPGQQLRIQEVSGSIVVKNLVEITCQSPTDVLRCLRQSSCNRAVGSTEMNAVSSRSHMVCRLTVQQFPMGSDSNLDQTALANKAAGACSEKEESAPAVTSQLTFVDLAGSERLKKTMATGNRKREGIAINKGLFHLGRVINANAMGKNDPHIYRVSKLTRLLQNALGGNSKTLFIACVSPAASNTDETLSTLRYANAAKNIQNKAVVNRSPQEIALLRAAVKLNAMTFEYVRVAHGTLGKATGDDAVHSLLASDDVVRNDIAAIQSKALENRCDLQSTSMSRSSNNHSRAQQQPLREHRRHHRSNSGSMPQPGYTKPPRRNNVGTAVNNIVDMKRRGISAIGAHATNTRVAAPTEGSTATTGKREPVPPMTDEDRQKFARLIEAVEASEKEMQAEHLAMIHELEAAEGERAEEEASSKLELEEALRSKEAAWQEIKEILVLYPAVQAEAEALKEEVGKIEQERTALEAECAAAEEHLKAQGGDGKLVQRLKAKVVELKGLHERKKREAKRKTDELTSMKRQQQRATNMKHEIEELKRQKTVQQRAHQRRVRDHREQLAKHKKLVAKSERKLREMKRDLADRTRKDVTRDAKLLRMSKEITKLKRERVRDAKKRRELLARRQRRIVQNKKRSTGRSASNRSYSQLHANRASRVAAQAEEQSKNLREMHRRRRNIELRIHRLEQEKDAAMQSKETLTEKLDEAFMSGDVSDEGVEELQTRIRETEGSVQRIIQEVNELTELAAELKIDDASEPELAEMNRELMAAQTAAEREHEEAEKERKKRKSAERAAEEEKRRNRELRTEKNEMVKKIRELESKLRRANKTVQEERMNAMRTPNGKYAGRGSMSPSESPVELRRRASERIEAQLRVEARQGQAKTSKHNNFTMPVIATSEIAAALEAEASFENEANTMRAGGTSASSSAGLLTMTSPGVKPMEISNGAAERIAKAAALSNSGKKKHPLALTSSPDALGSEGIKRKRKTHPTGTPISNAAATAVKIQERRANAGCSSSLVFAMAGTGLGPSGKASAATLAKEKFSTEGGRAAIGQFVASKRTKPVEFASVEIGNGAAAGKSEKRQLIFKIGPKKKDDIRKRITGQIGKNESNDSPSKVIIRDNALSKKCTKKEALRFKKAQMKQKRERQRRQAILQEEHKDKSRDRHGMDPFGKRLTREQIKQKGNAFMQSGQRNSKPLGAFPGSRGAQAAMNLAMGNDESGELHKPPAMSEASFDAVGRVRPVSSPAPFV